jgi:hypothetical protein
LILYVNGDSHTAAAEAVNAHAFAEDDGRYNFMGRLPHPENLAVSWGQVLANMFKAGLKCDAESAASNARILRTTRVWIKNHPASLSDSLLVIQWSTWERQEWLIEDVYYQINASGVDVVPSSHRDQYREFVASIDWESVTQTAHQDIWDLHCELQQQGIKHVFFNGNNHFGKIPADQQLDWNNAYIDPYSPKTTYNQWLLDNGHNTVAPDSWHFGRTAHAAWAKFVLQYIIKHQLS